MKVRGGEAEVLLVLSKARQRPMRHTQPRSDVLLSSRDVGDAPPSGKQKRLGASSAQMGSIEGGVRASDGG